MQRSGCTAGGEGGETARDAVQGAAGGRTGWPTRLDPYWSRPPSPTNFDDGGGGDGGQTRPAIFTSWLYNAAGGRQRPRTYRGWDKWLRGQMWDADVGCSLQKGWFRSGGRATKEKVPGLPHAENRLGKSASVSEDLDWSLALWLKTAAEDEIKLTCFIVHSERTTTKLKGRYSIVT